MGANECVIYVFRHAHTFAACSPQGRASHVTEACYRKRALHRRLLLRAEGAHVLRRTFLPSRSTRMVACHLLLVVENTPA